MIPVTSALHFKSVYMAMDLSSNSKVFSTRVAAYRHIVYWTPCPRSLREKLATYPPFRTTTHIATKPHEETTHTNAINKTTLNSHSQQPIRRRQVTSSVFDNKMKENGQLRIIDNARAAMVSLFHHAEQSASMSCLGPGTRTLQLNRAVVPRSMLEVLHGRAILAHATVKITRDGLWQARGQRQVQPYNNRHQERHLGQLAPK